MGFLSEVIAASDHTIRSSLTECIIWATICGRSMVHRQQSAVERVYGNVSQDFWDRHHWLDTILTHRMQLLLLHYPSASEHVDPLLLFTNMVAQTTILHLYTTIECMSWQTDKYHFIIAEYARKCASAAREIVILAKALSPLRYFKASPLVHVPPSFGPLLIKTGPSFYANSPLPVCKILHYSWRS
jgi:hypothetical protein